MSEKISPTEQKNDEQFVAAINQSLDKSLDDIDELNLQRLKNARIKAQANSALTRRKWVALGVAASLAALLLVPFVLQNYSHHSVEGEFEIVSQELPLSSEEMDDIDMLMALEDTDV